MDTTFHFMVDFTLPDFLSSEFLNLIPEQRQVVDLFFSEGSLVNYMLALDDAKLWAVFCANSEYEVMQKIAELPLTQFMEVKISQLTMHNTKQINVPVFSMN